MSNFKDLISLSDKLDQAGLVKEADVIDEYLSKIAKQGYHKCGLKQESIDNHLELLNNYKKAKDSLQTEYKKALKSSNEKDSANYGKLREIMPNLAYNTNSVNLHEMYLQDVVNNNPYSLEKDSQMKDLLKSLYGTEADFKQEILRLCHIPRSGWVLFNYCLIKKELFFSTIDLHDLHVITCAVPVLALDMWEHAYVNDFGNDREAYVKWFLDRIDWRNVRKRVKAIQKAK